MDNKLIRFMSALSPLSKLYRQVEHAKLQPLFGPLLVILFTLTGLSACQPVEESPLRIASNTWPGYEPLYLARSLGYYDDTQVNLVEMTSASEVIHALRNHTIEGAALTLDEVLTVMEDDYKLSVILIMDFSNGGDVLLSKPEITSLAQLKGKNIAVEYTAVGAILLNGALNSAQLTAKDVTITACSFDEHQSCYSQADAVVTFEPNRTNILNAGANQLFDSSKIPGRIIDVLAVHSSAIESHPNGLKDLITGYFKAIDYFDQKPLAAAELMKARLGLTANEVIESYKGLHLPSLSENVKLLTGNTPKLEKVAAELAAFMYKRKLLSHEVPVNAIATDRFTIDIAP